MGEDIYDGYKEEGEETGNIVISSDVETNDITIKEDISSIISPKEVDEEPDLVLVDLRTKAEIAAGQKSYFQTLREDVAALKSIHLGVGFCLLFLGFDACQDLVTTFHEEDGSIGLSILYVVYGLSSFFAPVIVELVGVRLSLFSASIGYVMFIICVEPYLDSIFYPISAIEGVAAALLWTAQPVYLSKCSSDPSTLGKYSGIFFSIFQTALVLGNLLSSALLSSSVKEENLLYILAAIGFCGSIVLALLRKPETKPTLVVKEKEREIGNVDDLNDSIELSINSSSSGKFHASPPTSPKLEVPMIPREENLDTIGKPNPLALVKQTLKLCINKKMLWLHPVFMHQGLSNAIFMGAFPMQMIAKNIGLVIATFGISNVIGSMFWGKVYDKKGWKVLVITALFVGPLSYFLSTLKSVGLWPLFLAAVAFGCLDSLQNILVFGIISSTYTEDKERTCAFAVSKFTNALASGVSFLVIPYLSYSILSLLGAINIVIVCACIYGMYKWQESSLSFINNFNFVFWEKNKSSNKKHGKLHDEL